MRLKTVCLALARCYEDLAKLEDYDVLDVFTKKRAGKIMEEIEFLSEDLKNRLQRVGSQNENV